MKHAHITLKVALCCVMCLFLPSCGGEEDWDDPRGDTAGIRWIQPRDGGSQGVQVTGEVPFAHESADGIIPSPPQGDRVIPIGRKGSVE